jgi:hypothetical protein
MTIAIVRTTIFGMELGAAVVVGPGELDGTTEGVRLGSDVVVGEPEGAWEGEMIVVAFGDA